MYYVGILAYSRYIHLPCRTCRIRSEWRRRPTFGPPAQDAYRSLAAHEPGVSSNRPKKSPRCGLGDLLAGPHRPSTVGWGRGASVRCWIQPEAKGARELDAPPWQSRCRSASGASCASSCARLSAVSSTLPELHIDLRPLPGGAAGPCGVALAFGAGEAGRSGAGEGPREGVAWVWTSRCATCATPLWSQETHRL